MISKVFTHPQEVLDLIAAKCAAVYRVPVAKVLGSGRSRERAYARHMFVLIAHELGVSKTVIANALSLSSSRLRCLLANAKTLRKNEPYFEGVYRGIMTYFQY